MKCMLQMSFALSNSKSFLGKVVGLICATTESSAVLVLQHFMGLNPSFGVL